MSTHGCIRCSTCSGVCPLCGTCRCNDAPKTFWELMHDEVVKECDAEVFKLDKEQNPEPV